MAAAAPDTLLSDIVGSTSLGAWPHFPGASQAKVRNVEEEGASGAAPRDLDDPLHGLAAEWAIEEAEEALRHDERCFLAGWEGAIAAKHIGWWNKGRVLAKKAMQSVPPGPQHRAQRETAGSWDVLGKSWMVCFMRLRSPLG